MKAHDYKTCAPPFSWYFRDDASASTVLLFIFFLRFFILRFISFTPLMFSPSLSLIVISHPHFIIFRLT